MYLKKSDSLDKFYFYLFIHILFGFVTLFICISVCFFVCSYQDICGFDIVKIFLKMIQIVHCMLQCKLELLKTLLIFFNRFKKYCVV